MVPTRPFARLATLAVLALSFVALLPDCASACTCGVEGSPKERARGAIADSDAVFSGEVVKLEKEPPETEMVEGTMLTVVGGGGRKSTVTLRVSGVWKGPELQTVRFTTPVDDGISCAFPFEEGREYLVYANGEQDLEVGGCSETKPLSGAGADLALLGEGEAPDGGSTLSDTSGGVPPLAVIGLAGLALAGSLLLAARLLRAG